MLFTNILLATVASAAVIGVPLQARNAGDASPEVLAHLEARQGGDHHGTMRKWTWYYMADLNIGHPAQNVSVIFDTGSPLLWVPGTNSTGCKENKCVSSFDVSKSSSWRYSKPGANWYGEGYWGTDSVEYAGTTLDDFNVYVSSTVLLNPEASIGVWGQSGHKDPKGNFVQGLADKGIISRPIYSLNANSAVNFGKWATEGVVTNVYYGGFDKKKYEGPLTTIDTSGYGAYGIPLTGFLVNGKKVEGEHEHSIVLDTGGVTFQVTNNSIGAVARANGGSWGPKGWQLECGSKPSLTYQFGYTTIDVDLTPYLTENDGNGFCRFNNAIKYVADDKDTLLAGPAVISKALVIYDNERSQITLGRARYTDESEVVEITGDIPGAHSYKDFLAGKPLA